MKPPVLIANEGDVEHSSYTLSRAIVEVCAEQHVGTLVVADRGGIQEDDENGEAWNYDDHGDIELRGCGRQPFQDTSGLQGGAEGIDGKLESERNISRSCLVCGYTDDTTARRAWIIRM